MWLKLFDINLFGIVAIIKLYKLYFLTSLQTYIDIILCIIILLYNLIPSIITVVSRAPGYTNSIIVYCVAWAGSGLVIIKSQGTCEARAVVEARSNCLPTLATHTIFCYF